MTRIISDLTILGRRIGSYENWDEFDKVIVFSTVEFSPKYNEWPDDLEYDLQFDYVSGKIDICNAAGGDLLATRDAVTWLSSKD